MPAVIIIQPVTAGLLLIDAARRHGLHPIVLSHQRQDLMVPAAAIAEGTATLCEVETNDQDAVLAMVKEIADGQDVLGVLPGFEYYVATAANAAASLGLPGLDPAVAECVRDKRLMRQALAAAGLAVPRFRVASSPAAAMAAAEAIGYPVVVKPPRAAGSVHVTLVAGPEELQAAYQALGAETELDLGDELGLGDELNPGDELGPEILVESYLDGPEYSAEGYVADGVATVVSITEKLLSAPPIFLELGHTVPADLPAPRLRELASWAATVAQALKVDNSPFHLEFRICQGMPVVVELGARLPGDEITNLVRLSTGVSLADVFVELAIGRKASDPPGLAAEFGQVAGIRFFTHPGLAELRRVPTTEQLLAAAPGVRLAEVTASAGDRPNAHQDFRTRLGWVVLATPDRATLDATWADLSSQPLFG
ncbi:MAG: ATP-grasp domain-containing protein [Jatrophihabitantaceae bacterium]